jgi:hypothetical protein
MLSWYLSKISPHNSSPFPWMPEHWTAAPLAGSRTAQFPLTCGYQAITVSQYSFSSSNLPDGPPPGDKGRQQHVTLILNTGAPQGCVISPLLYSLFTHDSNTIKFADDTTVVGLITNNDETAYKGEVRELAVWCQDNNLSLNVSKTKELIIDYRKRRDEQAPINIEGAVVERVESFKFLGVHITNTLSWSKHTKTVTKRARQHLFPLRGD